MGQLSLEFLGSWQVSLDGQPLTGFESGKVRALLTFLPWRGTVDTIAKNWLSCFGQICRVVPQWQIYARHWQI